MLMDQCLPTREESIGSVCFIDDFSKYRRIFLIRKKNEVGYWLITFLKESEFVRHHSKALRCDGDTELDNEYVEGQLTARGIDLRITAPESPEQKGAAEQEKRQPVELAILMMSATNLPKANELSI